MNQQQRKELVHYRITKANETLFDVDVLVQNERWNVAVNRLYYACFYAVSALLGSIDVFTRTHSGTRQMFGKYFVKTGKITMASGIFYGEIFDKRHEGDYDDFVDFSEQDVLILIGPAKELVGEIEAILNI